MLTKPIIQLRAKPDFSAFQFYSRGNGNLLTRQINFIASKKPRLFDLDFGDCENGQLHPYRLTDDGDLETLVTTLLHTLEIYTEKYPERTVRLKGNTKHKARIFHIALDTHLDVLCPHFEIEFEQEQPLLSLKRIRYPLAFLLRRKPGVCFSVYSTQTIHTSHSLLFGKPIAIEVQKNLHIGVVAFE
jgi:hypothetical protein